MKTREQQYLPDAVARQLKTSTSRNGPSPTGSSGFGASAVIAPSRVPRRRTE